MGDTVAPARLERNAASSRIDPDTRGVQWTVVGLVGLLGLTSFLVSFRALHDVAAWAGIGPGLQWAVPVFIDGAILTYALAVLVHRSRGEAVWPSWTSLGVFTAMSVAANAAHAVAAPQELWWQTWVGAALAALAPLGVFAATEQMARLVVLRPQDRQPAAQTAEPVEGPSSVPELQEEATVSAPAPESVEGAVVPGQSPDLAPQPAPAPETADVATAPEPESASEAPAEEPAAAELEPQAPVVEPERDTSQATVTELDEAQDGPEGPSEEAFAEWVQGRRRVGEPVTGPTAGAFLGVSERTGRNRIKELRAARPELFEEDAA